MTHSRWLVVVGGLITLSATGCAVRATGGARAVVYTPEIETRAVVQTQVQAPHVVVFSEPPPLVMVEPDIYVVEDNDQPVYYTGGYYYLYRDDGWYQTSRWNQPWARVTVNVVPRTITHRNHRSYVHFRARAEAHVWREPRVHVAGSIRLERHPRVSVEHRPKHVVPQHDVHHPKVVRPPTPAAGPLPDHARRDREREDRLREQAARARQERDEADRRAAHQRRLDAEAEQRRKDALKKKKVDKKKHPSKDRRDH